MNREADVIIVGSGPSGAQAAQTLIERGLQVLMLDVGAVAASDVAPVPARPFEQLRRLDPEQYQYWLGSDYEGVPLARLGAAPQVTPPRRHIVQTAPARRPWAQDFAALESHALGGLGGAWGAVSFPFLDVELERAGLPVPAMRASYERVARRIGISGAEDELSAWRGPLAGLQLPAELDHNAQAVLERYPEVKHALARRRTYVGRPLLALLTAPLGERQPTAGHDLDFWANPGGSAYRPEITIQQLQQRDGGFTYQSGWWVDRFAREGDDVVVYAESVDGTTRRCWRARRLLLAAGALGTARLVLRSVAPEAVVPLVCNAHLYVPCVHLRMIGQPHADRCHSLAQLTMIHDPVGDRRHLVQGQMYSYRSLLLFRLLKESPLAYREGLRVMRALAPSFVIWAIEHEDEPRADSFCRLRQDPDDRSRLEVVHQADPALEKRRRAADASMMAAMRRLGCWPLRRVHSGAGSSLHYGGMFPCVANGGALTTDTGGQLNAQAGVHVVDGAALRYLPAKGLTFTLMANADRVAHVVADQLQAS